MTLHKKMLDMLKNASAAEKSKKMKDILNLQKKSNDLKKDLLEIVAALEEIENEEKRRILGYAGGSMIPSNSVPVPPMRSFRLDKRTTCLCIDGLQDQKDSISLDEMKESLSTTFGFITSMEWIERESNTIKGQQEHVSSSTTTETIWTILLNCSSRGIAEQIKSSNIIDWNGTPITFSWYRKSTTTGTAAAGATSSSGDHNNTEEYEEDEDENYDEGDEGNFQWNEDDDLMVDYD